MSCDLLTFLPILSGTHWDICVISYILSIYLFFDIDVEFLICRTDGVRFCLEVPLPSRTAQVRIIIRLLSFVWILCKTSSAIVWWQLSLQQVYKLTRILRVWFLMQSNLKRTWIIKEWKIWSLIRSVNYSIIAVTIALYDSEYYVHWLVTWSWILLPEQRIPQVHERAWCGLAFASKKLLV